ncbi:MAG: hypothetical protein LBV41_05575 [Cytophagaceae bacterium]|jgi:hypothetical protein|nr:hypothetical protein [Cytophagaceae bacterium]
MEDEVIDVKHKKQKRRVTPRKEVDIITVSLMVRKTWEKSGLVLKWTTPDEFEQNTTEFKRIIDASNHTVGERRVITNRLSIVNADIDKSLKYVKGYIGEMFGKNEEYAYYTQFGIVRDNKMYIIPRDNDTREQSLEQMLQAIERNGMAGSKYGLEYWQSLYNRFVIAKNNAAAHDSDSASHVSAKNDLKAKIIKTLNALVFMIKANYPDSWKEELRVWGFQKDKY